MELTHSFDVPVPPERAWTVLTDIERIAPCMPGATLDSVDGDTFTGSVKVKVGPMQLTYRGTAQLVHLDAVARTATIEAGGRETRGPGTARATVHAALAGDASHTTVTLRTALAVTGKPAQFGRGVLDDVGAKLVATFAEQLAVQVAADDVTAADDGRRGGGEDGNGQTVGARPEARPIDVLALGTPALVRRLAPLALLAAVVVLVWRRRRVRRL